MRKTNKKLIVAILISSLFICVGYAEITNIVLNITGSVGAIAQTEVFITDVTTTSEASTVNGYLGTVLNTKTVLGTNSSSTVSYNVNLYNNSEKEYVFIGVLKHDDLYSNTNIDYTLTGLTEYETTIEPNTSLTFTITFKYAGTDVSNNVLESKLNFRFREKPEISLSNEGEEYTLENIYPGYTPQEYKFTVTNKNIETGKTNNVPMEYTFETTIEEPLEIKIYDGTNEITGSVALEGEKEYTLKIIWDESKNSTEYANKEYSCKVVLKAKTTNTDYAEYEINKEFNINITTAKFYFGAEVDGESLELKNNEASLGITLKNYNSSSEYNNYETNYQISLEDTSKFNLILEDENNGVIAKGANTNTVIAKIKLKDGQTISGTENVNLIIKATKPYEKEITKTITIETKKVFNFTGSGTEDSPYLINNEDDLRYLAEEVNSGEKFTGACFEVTNDIEISDFFSYKEWIPIGNSAENYFDGIIDFLGKNVGQLYISEDGDYKGLFGHTGSNSVIKNIDLYVNEINTEGIYVGGLVGYNEGRVISSRVQVNNHIIGTKYVGGVAGYNTGSISEDSHNDPGLPYTGNDNINFTIDGATYIANPGWTWEEWIDTSYNINLDIGLGSNYQFTYHIDGIRVAIRDDEYEYCYVVALSDGTTFVTLDDEIEENYEYTTIEEEYPKFTLNGIEFPIVPETPFVAYIELSCPDCDSSWMTWCEDEIGLYFVCEGACTSNTYRVVDENGDIVDMYSVPEPKEYFLKKMEET